MSAELNDDEWMNLAEQVDDGTKANASTDNSHDASDKEQLSNERNESMDQSKVEESNNSSTDDEKSGQKRKARDEESELAADESEQADGSERDEAAGSEEDDSDRRKKDRSSSLIDDEAEDDDAEDANREEYRTSDLADYTTANSDEEEEAETKDGDGSGVKKEDGDGAGNKRRRLKKQTEVDASNVKRIKLGGGGGGGGDAFLDDDAFDEEGEDDMSNFIVDDTGDGRWKDADENAVELAMKALKSKQHAYTPFQPSFQSGATPYINAKTGVKQATRFLCWNTYGNITARDEEYFQSVEILFSDAANNRPVRIRDYYKFYVAALGQHGAIFASKSHKGTGKKLDASTNEIDKDRPGTIFYKPFDSWANNSEWTYQMLTGEEPTAVAIGKRYAAVAVEGSGRQNGKNDVRLFHYSGIQRTVLSVAGQIVTMAGFNDLLAIVYHSGQPYNHTQHLTVMLLEVKTQDTSASNSYNIKQPLHCRTICHSRLPISPNSTLQWCDFSDTGMLLTYDTRGILRALCRVWDYSWSVTFDSNVKTVNGKKGKNESYWPIGMIDNKLMVALCKWQNAPQTQPKPTLLPLTIQIPFLHLADSITQNEEQFTQSDMLLAEQWDSLTNGQRIKKQAVADKLLLQLINHACSSVNNKEVRALDFSTLLYLEKSLQLAIAVANKNNRTNVASRMGLLLEAKFAGQAQVDPNEVDKYSLESFIAAEQEKEAKKQKRLSERRASNDAASSSNNDGVTQDADDDEAEAEAFSNQAKKGGRLRRISAAGDNNTLPTRRNGVQPQPKSSSVADKENLSFTDINTLPPIDAVNSKSTKQSKLFADKNTKDNANAGITNNNAASTSNGTAKSLPTKVNGRLNPFAKKQ